MPRSSYGSSNPDVRAESNFYLAGNLRADLLRPRNPSEEAGGGELAVLVLHPMYYLGGDKENYVVIWLQHHFVHSHKLPAFRYNTSSPSLRGYSEAADAVRAVEFLAGGSCPLLPQCRRVLVCGYSAGANAAISVGNTFANDERLAGMIALSPPFGWIGSMFLGGLVKTPSPCRRPQLYVNGTSDGYCSSAAFIDTVKKMFPNEEIGGSRRGPLVLAEPGDDNRCTRVEGENATAVLVPYGGHFWAPREFRGVILYLEYFVKNKVLDALAPTAS
eukprot:g13870.t1